MQIRPKIVGFYAYKGGTGRSFCLAHTAWALAREGWRVVLLDLDLSAPSLWALFGQQPAPGLVEYLDRWSCRNPLRATELVQEISLDPKALGALYLMQAGRMDESYLATLQTLDWQRLVELPPLTERPSAGILFDMSSPFNDLFKELATDLNPDAILIDAPTGFNDASNLCLRSLTDLVIAIFGPSRVQIEGISRVVSLLTAEQNRRRERDPDPKPDVYCVASTILQSRLAGSHVKRITEAFNYLDRVRYDAIASADNLEAQIEEISHQEPAMISYDERLADLESLPTDSEPREAHFAMFQDVISYVSGSLPPPRPRVLLDAARKQELLKGLEPNFILFAEQDPELISSLFLRTQHIEEFRDPRVVVILGGKGSGKTALFSFITKDKDVFAVHGPGNGLAPDLLCNIQDEVPSMDVFWRLYMLSVLPNTSAVTDSGVRKLAEIISRLPDNPLKVRELIDGLREGEIAVRVFNAWSEVEGSLAADRRQIILCLDGLDAAFKADSGRRKRGLVQLFSAWQSSFSKMRSVSVKIFLRTDLWQDLSFPEKSHFRGKEMRLAWDKGNLWRLVAKRALHSGHFRRWCDDSLNAPVMNEGAVETAGERDLHPYLDRLFEHHIWAGKNSLTRTWILRRLEDAKDAIYPRDLVCLLQEAIHFESERLREGQRYSEESAISRQSVSVALDPTSRQRVDALREEYPELGPVLDSLKGQNSTGALETLKRFVKDDKISVLSEAGVIRLKEEGNYLVPDLYRHGLEMPRMGPR